LSTTCDSPTDAISDCLNVDRVRRRFVATSFFLVAAVAHTTVRDSFDFSVCNNLIVIEQKCANIIK